MKTHGINNLRPAKIKEDKSSTPSPPPRIAATPKVPTKIKISGIYYHRQLIALNIDGFNYPIKRYRIT